MTMGGTSSPVNLHTTPVLPEHRVSLQTFIVDRIEDGAIVVLEDDQERTLAVPASWLPRDLSEGDVLQVAIADTEEGRAVRFEIDRDATRRLRNEAAALRTSLDRAPEGDIEL
jgi:hypothetical protein